MPKKTKKAIQKDGYTYYWQVRIPATSQGMVKWDDFFKDHVFLQPHQVTDTTAYLTTAKISKPPS